MNKSINQVDVGNFLLNRESFEPFIIRTAWLICCWITFVRGEKCMGGEKNMGWEEGGRTNYAENKEEKSDKKELMKMLEK